MGVAEVFRRPVSHVRFLQVALRGHPRRLAGPRAGRGAARWSATYSTSSRRQGRGPARSSRGCNLDDGLASPDSAVGRIAVYFDEAVPLVINVLKNDDDDHVRAAAVWASVNMRTMEVISPLITNELLDAKTHDDSGLVRNAAAEVLQAVGVED